MNKKYALHFATSIDVSEFISLKKSGTRIDVSRMSSAMRTESIKAPSNMSKEEKRQFIISHSK